ncbi:ABC transporter ATP-binding protein [Alteromonas gilva]|uniref:ABC transporter ATP-binding protein n=1 Tax=Alteromonas gilva TaxID=2987522 RepID=A0ABT5L4M2_9ALTE|nr:ABC transporter ATP-binding protein [Alteromonas gilva]MDC8831808.1 ABC transporter ATP-binding protein [Alteromonas gilva]
MRTDSIEVNHLSKEYKLAKKSVFALRDIEFNVKKGDVVGILGPNGSGKSTLIKVLLSVVMVDDIEMRFNGQKVGTKANNKAYLKDVGAIVEGNKEMMERLSAYENAKYYCRLRNVKFDKDYFEYLADILSLSEHDKQARYLSTGNKQKAALINAIIHKPSLVILDEPTLGMDVHCLSALESLINALSQEHGATFIITSHDLRFIERVVKRLICLRNGVKIYDGSLLDFNAQNFLYEISVQENIILKEWLKEQDFGMFSNNNSLFMVKNLGELSTVIQFVIDNEIDQNSITISKYDLEQQFKEST